MPISLLVRILLAVLLLAASPVFAQTAAVPATDKTQLDQAGMDLDKDGEQLEPVRSSVGLALTRSLLAVNACSLSVDPTPTTGTLFSLVIPSDVIIRA